MATVLSSGAEIAGGAAAAEDVKGGGGGVVSIRCSLFRLRLIARQPVPWKMQRESVSESVRRWMAASSIHFGTRTELGLDGVSPHRSLQTCEHTDCELIFS